MKIGLSLANNWDESDAYIFPNKIEQIPACKGVNDFETLYHYALEKMESYREKEIDLYINSGLSSELLQVIKVAAKLNIKCNLYFWNKDTNEYVKHELIWKPQKKKKKQPVKSLAVCAKRHEALKRLEYIIGEIENENLFNLEWMKEEARNVLKDYKEYHLEIYPTGLTQAYITVLDVAAEFGITTTMMLHDAYKKKYLPVEMDN